MTNEEFKEKLSVLESNLGKALEVTTDALNATTALIEMDTNDIDFEIFYSDLTDHVEELDQYNKKIQGMFQKK